MKIPEDWIKAIAKRSVYSHPFLVPPEYDDAIEKQIIEVEKWVYSKFNAKWEIPVGAEDDFKDWFMAIAVFQTNPCSHPLTCGVDSNHTDLYPRITYQKECLLVCADCGYIQKFDIQFKKEKS